MPKLQSCRCITFPWPQSFISSPAGTQLQLSLLAIICIVCLFCAAVIPAAAQSVYFTSLVSFDWSNGASPYDALVQGADGNFYGTTAWGGSFCSPNGCGTVFKMTATGALTTLHSFESGADGSVPWGGLVQASDGNFYGTTAFGGANGSGTVFRITPDGTLTTLHSFNGFDGFLPYSSLVLGTDGNLYGTTVYGGATADDGTVFKITLAGTLTSLYSFCSQPNCADGAEPFAGLVQGSDGDFYGTTTYGGSNSCSGGCGTVFKITPAGALTMLHSFDNSDGRYTQAGLVQGSDGNFYGTTYLGGPYDGGTVFKITLSGTLTTVHSFDYTDGAIPYAAPVQSSDGNFYGTTGGGGAYSAGTVFTMTSAGLLTTLFSFDGTDGGTPQAGLVQATNGIFYGTTSGGGIYATGTIFRLGVVHSCTICRP